jgi:anti-sigma factor RsiW
MARCSDIEPLMTPYVDGEVPPGDRLRVAGHIDDCPPCQRHAAAEQAARSVVRAHADSLVETAPAHLRGRCAAVGRSRAAFLRGLPRLSRAGWPIALAATLVLAVGGALVYGTVVDPARAVAAQLTIDHLKCFALFDQPSALKPSDVQAALKARYGFDVELPEADAAGGMTLVGGRRCLYLDGSVAHVLYKRGQVPVSLFVLPPGARLSHTEIEIFGHTAVAFERGGRTWVVVAREARADVEQAAAVFGSRSAR